MEQCIANNLVDKLAIDRSYMSKIIAKLNKDGVISKELSKADGRTSLIRLTAKGLALFNQLNEKSDEQITRLLQDLTQKEIKELHTSVLFIQSKLSKLEEI